jgi:hypothetical protein
LHFAYRFGASIKENGCTQPTIGKYNAHISKMQFLCIAKRVSKSERDKLEILIQYDRWM